MAYMRDSTGKRLDGMKVMASDSVGDRLRIAAANAVGRNSIERAPMAAPPTITTGTSNLDAALTKNYLYQNVGLAPFRLTGGTAQLYATVYVTAPVVTKQAGSGGNTPGDATKSQCHWAVEFMTDAPDVMIRYLNNSAPYAIEVDDQAIAAQVVGGALTKPSTTGTGYTKLAFGSSAIRKIRVEFSEASGFTGVYIGPTYQVWRPKSPVEIRAAWVGDSIMTGTGAVFPGLAQDKVAAKLLGWTDSRQIAFGSTGFTTSGSGDNTFGSALRIADAVAVDPDILIIQASQNDGGVSNASAITAAALAAFQAYRTALPDVPIVVLGVHAASSGPSADRAANEAAVKSAFLTWADDNSWFIPVTASTTDSWESGTGNASSPSGSGNRDRLGHDTAHPNVLGHLYNGRRIASEIKNTVLPFIS